MPGCIIPFYFAIWLLRWPCLVSWCFVETPGRKGSQVQCLAGSSTSQHARTRVARVSALVSSTEHRSCFVLRRGNQIRTSTSSAETPDKKSLVECRTKFAFFFPTSRHERRGYAHSCCGRLMSFPPRKKHQKMFHARSYTRKARRRRVDTL